LPMTVFYTTSSYVLTATHFHRPQGAKVTSISILATSFGFFTPHNGL
jgi:hypothetical protein